MDDSHAPVPGQLPTDKYEAWKDEVLNCIQSRKCTRDSIGTLVGHLNHNATDILLARHFLRQIRDLIDQEAFRKALIYDSERRNSRI
jgi:hypothetical protein